MPPLDLPTLSTKIKHVIAQWIALHIMDDDGYILTFAEVTNPNIIKVVAKSSCIIHPPNLSNYTTN